MQPLAQQGGTSAPDLKVPLEQVQAINRGVHAKEPEDDIYEDNQCKDEEFVLNDGM